MRWIQKVQEVLFNPSEYFKQMPTEGGYKGPTAFALKNITISAVLGALFSYVFTNFLLKSLGLSGTFEGSIEVLTGIEAIAQATGVVIGGLIGIFIGAAILHALLYLLGGKGDYESTFRVVSSATSTMLFGWIPLVNIVASIYAIYLEVVGFSEVHDISRGKAFLAILIPILVAVALVVIVAMIMFFMLGSVMSNTPEITGNFLLPF